MSQKKKGWRRKLEDRSESRLAETNNAYCLRGNFVASYQREKPTDDLLEEHKKTTSSGHG